LIHADWLDEHGQTDRAEFIRLQVELECLPGGAPQAPDLRCRSVLLQAEHERQWLGEWADRLVNWTFHGGYLDSVVLTPEHFLRDGQQLFERFPVRKVAFMLADGSPVTVDVVAELVASPHMAAVRALAATAPGPDGGAVAVR